VLWEASVDPLNAKLNPIRHLLALLGHRLIFRVSRIRVNDIEIELKFWSYMTNDKNDVDITKS
jgi:hypothetical protein